ncbi:probable adenylate kinase 7, mitochondrial isoform X2 [Beta vulgaris subsp. vulgaris]|uniref:probable adenylate kinase 7, mitochondrial isoform X2 n=1 Tax=Beta vulgaris subsp. vulgaris TaxID=3555 RepID=UPI002036EC5E|nr:probable adenylate kinase 7, mitochondrial isoform X2 [Beta vulgaris subsp. vulgaris]
MAVLSRLSTTSSGGLRRLLHLSRPLYHLPIVRPYGIAVAAAAAVQPQFDFDDDYKNNPPPVTDAAAVDTESSRPLRGVQWVFIGNPNSKKHIYADMISKLLQVPHISISTLLRQDLHPHSPLYKQEILDQLVDIDLVVNFKCSEDYFRAAGSPVDSTASRDRTKSSFSNLNNTAEEPEPKVAAYYKEQIQFLEDYYQNQKKLIDFQVGNAPGETWKGLIAALHLQHINAVHSSRTLTMGSRVP